jgi:hypothetical protein
MAQRPLSDIPDELNKHHGPGDATDHLPAAKSAFFGREALSSSSGRFDVLAEACPTLRIDAAHPVLLPGQRHQGPIDRQVGGNRFGHPGTERG